MLKYYCNDADTNTGTSYLEKMKIENEGLNIEYMK